MPILGILASSTPAAAGDYESIATVTVGAGGTSTINFSSIPSTYTHLQVRWIANQATTTSMLNIRVNNDTSSSNYTIHSLNGNGSTVGANNAAPAQYVRQLRAGGVSATTNIFSAGIIDILDYANTNKNKTFRLLGGTDLNGSGDIAFESGMWINNSTAINQLEFFCTYNFNQYSHFALYGIKSA